MPRDAAATRQRILDVAEQLVIENGYAATSVDEVIAKSGTSKGSFFHHFDTKLALARALVDRYAAADMEQLTAVVAEVTAASDDPVRRVIDFIRTFENAADEVMSAQSSCLYIAVLTERQLAAAGTGDQIVAAIEAWRHELSTMLRAAFRARGLRGLDVTALADHIFATFEGAFLLARSTGDPGVMRAQLKVLRQLIERLLA